MGARRRSLLTLNCVFKASFLREGTCESSDMALRLERSHVRISPSFARVKRIW